MLNFVLTAFVVQRSQAEYLEPAYYFLKILFRYSCMVNIGFTQWTAAWQFGQRGTRSVTGSVFLSSTCKLRGKGGEPL